MWNYIKIELRRGFWNRNMLWALLAVLLISFGQIALDVFPMLQYLKPITADTPAKEILFPHTVFEKGGEAPCGKHVFQGKNRKTDASVFCAGR